MSGLVHSRVILKLDHIVSSIDVTNSSHGFFKSDNHFSSILNIATSLVVQNLFFKDLSILRLSNLSHSKNKTVSTICSRVFGQASAQSLFICHIINRAVLVILA